jgi:hypothetical protein
VKAKKGKHPLIFQSKLVKEMGVYTTEEEQNYDDSHNLS